MPEEVHSDWGDWLPNAIHEADPDGVAVWYLGCNGLVLKGRDGTTIFVDPYLGTGDPPRTVRMIPVPFDPADVHEADAVFATHEHTDHTHGPSQAPILAGTGAPFYGPDDSVAVAVSEEQWPQTYGVETAQLETVVEGDVVDVGEFDVHVVETNDPDSTHPVGYVFEHEAGTVFHGGDTRPADAFIDVGRRFDVDLGVLAFGTVGYVPDKTTGEPQRTRWYNDENEIVEAAEALALDRLLPTHWDMWRGLEADPTVLHHHVKSFEYPRRLEIASIGDRVDV